MFSSNGFQLYNEDVIKVHMIFTEFKPNILGIILTQKVEDKNFSLAKTHGNGIFLIYVVNRL